MARFPEISPKLVSGLFAGGVYLGAQIMERQIPSEVLNRLHESAPLWADLVVHIPELAGLMVFFLARWLLSPGSKE